MRFRTLHGRELLLESKHALVLQRFLESLSQNIENIHSLSAFYFRRIRLLLRRDPYVAVAFSSNPLFICQKLKYEKAPYSIFDHRDFIRAQSAACSLRPAEQRDHPVC